MVRPEILEPCAEYLRRKGMTPRHPAFGQPAVQRAAVALLVDGAGMEPELAAEVVAELAA